MQKIGNTVIAILFTFLKKMWTSSMVFYFRAIFLSCLTTEISGNLLQICIAGSGYALKKLLDPDPHSEEQLDPDLKKMNSDPQLCSHHSVCKV